jgi:hypothetical protein
MKSLLTAALIVLSTSVSAEAIKSTASAEINISRVERAISLDAKNGRISLVEVDNGGSTDISSMIVPSQLLLTYFADGEMNNVYATFDLGGIVTLVGAKMSSPTVVKATIKVKDEAMKETTKTITLNIAKLVSDAKEPTITVEEFEDQLLDTTIIAK